MKLPHSHHRDLTNYRVIPDPIYGYLRLDPVPTEEETKEIYAHHYFEEQRPDLLYRALEEKDYWAMVFDERFEIIERFVTQKSPRILDIGSFLGSFLESGKKRGWDVLGIEPSQQGFEFTNNNGIKTLKGFFEDFDKETLGTFQAINLSHVLEHVRHPALMLEKAHGLLSPGGIVCVTVPNDFNILQESARKLLQLHEYWVCPPDHINYFSFDTLSALFEKSGFHVVDRCASFPIEFFLFSGKNYIGDDDTGLQCHKKIMTYEQNLHKGGLKKFKEKLYRFFAQEGVGRAMVLFGQKSA